MGWMKPLRCICSSKDIVQPLFHAKTLNVKYWLTSVKLRKLSNITFIFDVLSENVITFVRMCLFCGYFEAACAYAYVQKYFTPQMYITQFKTLKYCL